MSFDAAERSVTGGAPVECYTFARGLRVWRYTSAERDVTLDGVVFRAAAIRRDQIRRDDELAAARLTITMDRRTPLAADLRAGRGNPAPLMLTLHRAHVGSEGDPKVIFGGPVVQVVHGEGGVTLSAESIQAMFGRRVLRMTCGRTCQNTLYDARCGVNPADHAVAATVGAIAGRTITPAGLSGNAATDGWFEAGVAEHAGAQGLERYYVERHVGGVLTLDRPLRAGATGADAITLYPGCDRTEASCGTKFNNLANFLGFPDVPVTNPWEDVR